MAELSMQIGVLAAVVLVVAACGQPPAPSQGSERVFDRLRARMVEQQLQRRDITSQRVLDVMGRVPRHRFVPEERRGDAYGDYPLPIGQGQTISQPYIVGFMTQALDVAPSHRVLEIGTGSGYQAAVLSELAKEVYTIEIIPELGQRAQALLAQLGYRNVSVRIGNGYLGWPEAAPFDRVIVTAAPDEVPRTLIEQLKVGGIMVIPVGSGYQELRVLRRTPDGVETLKTLPVQFVPMTGKPKGR